MDKKRWRKMALAARKKLGDEERKKRSRKIINYLLESPLYQRAQKVLLYASFDHEVETWDLLKKALADGKEVYLPKTDLEHRTLHLHRVYSLEELRPGAYGILEPPAENPTISSEELDLIVVPGVAFDREGGRLGYGGGYYDRLLSQAPKVSTVALAFSCQVFEKLPLEPHDVRIQVLITEEGLQELG